MTKERETKVRAKENAISECHAVSCRIHDTSSECYRMKEELVTFRNLCEKKLSKAYPSLAPAFFECAKQLKKIHEIILLDAYSAECQDLRNEINSLNLELEKMPESEKCPALSNEN